MAFTTTIWNYKVVFIDLFVITNMLLELITHSIETVTVLPEEYE